MKRIASILMLLGALACSSERDAPESIDLEVSQVLVTEPVLGERAAMYFSVTNNGSADDELLGVSAAAARNAEIHSTEHEGGTVKMVPIAGLTVPAGARVDLAPGGYHVMLTEIEWSLEPGDRFDVTLHFRVAGDLAARARVVSYADLEERLGVAAEHGARDTQ